MLKGWRSYYSCWALSEFARREHVFYRHLDGKTTTVPHHKGRVLARPLIREILREIELTVDDYNKHLKRL